jgi:hypothetical protein
VRGRSAGLWRWVLLAVGSAVVATLCAAAILFAGSRPEETSKTSAPDGRKHSPRSDHATTHEPTIIDGHRILTAHEALVQDARYYAKDYGVPLEEAIRRLQMQDDQLLTRLERKLKKEEPDSYAGLWLRHKPDYGFTVALAEDSEAAAAKTRRFVEGTQWEGTVNIKHVEASMIELNAARAGAERMLDRLGIAYSSGDNLFKNRMEIYVTNRDRALRKLDAAGLELSEHVVILEGMGLIPQEGSYPATGRDPSTPPGASRDSACSLRMAREMTRRCISEVPS